MKIAILFTLALAAITILSRPALAGGGSSVGMGNPAAEFCIQLGGKSELVTDAAGNQDDNCAIDEWTLYRATGERNKLKDHNYNHGDGSIGMPNPAAVNCNDLGGQYRIVDTPAGQSGECVVEGWSLFRQLNSSSCIKIQATR